MKASVLIVMITLSVISIGSAAVLFLDGKPSHANGAKLSGAAPQEFRWGEGTEASMTPAETAGKR